MTRFAPGAVRARIGPSSVDSQVLPFTPIGRERPRPVGVVEDRATDTHQISAFRSSLSGPDSARRWSFVSPRVCSMVVSRAV